MAFVVRSGCRYVHPPLHPPSSSSLSANRKKIPLSSKYIPSMDIITRRFHELFHSNDHRANTIFSLIYFIYFYTFLFHFRFDLFGFSHLFLEMYPDSREIDSILLQESNTRKSRNTNCPTIHPVKFFLPYNESLSRARSLNAREEKLT